MRMPKRVDANQKQIVKELRDIGLSVLILSEVGKGCPDILVGYKNSNFLFELKDGKKLPSQQKLTDHEKKFHDAWLGQVNVTTTTEQILKVIDKNKLWFTDSFV